LVVGIDQAIEISANPAKRVQLPPGELQPVGADLYPGLME